MDENSLKQVYKLTPKQNEVLTYLVKGLTDKQIANEMLIKHRTVQSHLSEIYSKLNVKNRTEACFLTLNFKPSKPASKDIYSLYLNTNNVFDKILGNILFYRLKSNDDLICSAEYHLATSAFMLKNNCSLNYLQSLSEEFRKELDYMCNLIEFTLN